MTVSTFELTILQSIIAMLLFPFFVFTCNLPAMALSVALLLTSIAVAIQSR